MQSFGGAPCRALVELRQSFEGALHGAPLKALPEALPEALHEALPEALHRVLLEPLYKALSEALYEAPSKLCTELLKALHGAPQSSAPVMQMVRFYFGLVRFSNIQILNRFRALIGLIWIGFEV